MSHVFIAEGHATDVLARPLTTADANLVTAMLGHAGIPVELSTDAAGIVQLWPLRAFTTAEEVQAHRAIAAVSDSRIAWHGRGSA